ncbi:MAG: hypothetical protein QXP54_06150 [Thermofilum sp.]
MDVDYRVNDLRDLKYAEGLIEKARGLISRSREELKGYYPS